MTRKIESGGDPIDLNEVISSLDSEVKEQIAQQNVKTKPMAVEPVPDVTMPKSPEAKPVEAKIEPRPDVVETKKELTQEEKNEIMLLGIRKRIADKKEVERIAIEAAEKTRTSKVSAPPVIDSGSSGFVRKEKKNNWWLPAGIVGGLSLSVAAFFGLFKANEKPTSKPGEVNPPSVSATEKPTLQTPSFATETNPEKTLKIDIKDEREKEQSEFVENLKKFKEILNNLEKETTKSEQENIQQMITFLKKGTEVQNYKLIFEEMREKYIPKNLAEIEFHEDSLELKRIVEYLRELNESYRKKIKECNDLLDKIRSYKNELKTEVEAKKTETSSYGSSKTPEITIDPFTVTTFAEKSVEKPTPSDRDVLYEQSKKSNNSKILEAKIEKIKQRYAILEENTQTGINQRIRREAVKANMQKEIDDAIKESSKVGKSAEEAKIFRSQQEERENKTAKKRKAETGAGTPEFLAKQAEEFKKEKARKSGLVYTPSPKIATTRIKSYKI
jgi:hypothetical protein